MNSTLANWNGQEMNLEDVRVSVLDRAFLLGDGVYEVIRVYGGRAWKADEHITRLGDSLAAVKIDGVSIDQLKARMLATLKASGVDDGLIYIQITRGVARRSHHFPQQCTPNELIYVERFDDPYASARQSGCPVITYPDIRWARNHIKAVSLLANCLAAQAAIEAGCVEAVLIDKQGYVTEGSHTSVFAVKDGKLLVAPDGASILPGITKRQVLELARRGAVPVAEHRLTVSELSAVDELFLSGTPEEILAVTTIDGVKVGDGRPGPVTRKLQQAFAAAVDGWVKAATTASGDS